MEQNTDLQQTSPVKTLSPAVLIIVVVVILGVFMIGKMLFSNKSVNIVDTQVSLLTATYEKMPKPLVHGEIQVTIKGKSLTGQTATFCLATEGTVVKQGDKTMIQCLKKDIKQVSVDDRNMLFQRLNAGIWLMNISLVPGITSIDLPARIAVHSGEITHAEITVQ